MAIRAAIFNELTRHKDKYSVEILDLAVADKRLSEASLSESAVVTRSASDLCSLLEVDAVMKGSVTRYGMGGEFAGTEVKVDVAIYDGPSGQLLMQHNITVKDDMYRSPDALAKEVASEVARIFPYRRHQ
jgi:hypothetical protein